MALYNENDLDLLSSNWDKIKEDSEFKRREMGIIPTELDKLKIHNIIVSYIQENKRKVYGGFALNLLMKHAKGEKIYDDKDIHNHDIDFYSPDPISDLKNICNLIFKGGFKYIHGSEALHKETYTLKVDTLVYCDISYVPTNIYNRMPFIIVDGIYSIGADFMTIDYLRMMTDPMTSYWRIDADIKAFRRFYSLQKYYGFPDPDEKHDIDLGSIKKNPKTIKLMDFIDKNILKQKTLVNIGFYTYNQFVEDSNSKNYKTINIPYYEIISTEYIKDAEKIINMLKNESYNVTYEEYSPFFQFFGNKVKIYYEDVLVLIIYSNNHKSIPYIDKNNIKIGTFQMTLMYFLMNYMYYRVNTDNISKNLVHSTISNLYDIRNTYLLEKKKTILDNTPFKEFITTCVGETMTLQRERQIQIDKRKKKKEQLTFTYVPNEESINQIVEKNFIFSNSSGNKIINDKNKLLFNNKKSVYDVEDSEDSENSEKID